MPDEPEALGLLALMLLQDARRAARVDDAGDLVPLEEQDRTRWDARRDRRRASRCSTRALRRRRARPVPGAGGDRRVPRGRGDADETDWVEIALLYGELARMIPSPVVELNRAVAVAMADGPEAGLALVDALDAAGALAGYHLLPATRADLLRRLDRRDEAAAAYRAALELATTEPSAGTSSAGSPRSPRSERTCVPRPRISR